MPSLPPSVSEPCKFPDHPHCGEKRMYSRGCRHVDCRAAESRYRHESYLMGKILDPSIPKRRLGIQRPSKWMNRANCRNAQDEDWVPYGGRGEDLTKATRDLAKEFCTDCPVRSECFEYGVATKSDGIWGGHFICWQPRKRVVNLLG